MVKASVENIVLLPIKPKYATAIFEGTKKVEFRKVRFSRTVTHVIVYSSSPIKKIIGYFTVAAIETDTPHSLWKRFGQIGRISAKDFQVYYGSHINGTAIVIGETHKLKTPVPLDYLKPNLRAPQSFTYVSDVELNIIKSLIRNNQLVR